MLAESVESVTCRWCGQAGSVEQLPMPHRHDGRCGGRALTSATSPASVPDLVIRDAIETAFAVVVAGMRLRPPILPPPALKPLVRFQKIPPAALGQVRRAVEADEELRRRVAIVATEELVGRAGWLWIHRPEGWEAELAGLAAEEAAAELAAGQERAERSAQRRVEAAEQAARAAAAEVAGLRTELTGEREQRRQAEQDLARLERRAGQLDVELGGARRRLVAADARTEAAEDAVGPLQHRIDELEAEVARLTAEVEAARVGASAASGAGTIGPARTVAGRVERAWRRGPASLAVPVGRRGGG